ncbi:MAG: dihydrolipoamide acetyltransferase family protein [Pseudomonadota bacterium]
MHTDDPAIADGTVTGDDLVCVSMEQDLQDGTRAVLGTCLKGVGDAVQAHEPIAEVETDKVVVELAAPCDGVLAQWCFQPGDDLPGGAVVARLSRGGDVEGTDASPTPVTEASDPPTVGVRNGGPDASRRLSPAVKRLVAENHLDLTTLLASVRGSGRDGRLSAADVRGYLDRQSGARRHNDSNDPQGVTSDPRPASSRADDGASRRVPLSPMRRAIAEHLSRSLLHTAPHVTTVFECDMSRVLAHRKAHRDDYRQRGVDLTLSAYFVAATAQALREVPEVNSSLDGDDLLLWEEIHIGLAVALGDEGLVVPVLRDVHQRNLFGIAQGIADMTDRARSRSLTAKDMDGGTFTISNHGVSGSVLAAPVIINQPQSAILGIGKLRKEVVVREIEGEDVIRIAPLCYLTLSLDHRVLDAYQANRFLGKVVSTLEGWNTERPDA